MTNPRAPWYQVVLIQTGAQRGALLDLTSDVKSFQFQDNERKTDKLKLTVDNFDLRNFDNPVWRHGARLRVAFGNGISAAPARIMVVKKVTGGINLNVEANDLAVMMDTRKNRNVYENMTRSEVVTEIAARYGFSADNIQETTEVFEIMNQGNLSDAEYVRKLAHLQGYQFFVDFDGLHWHERRAGQAPIRTLHYYAADPRNEGDIKSFNVENDITRKPGRVRVQSRDPMEQTEIEAVADNTTDTSRDVLQPLMGVIDPEIGVLTTQSDVSYETTIASNVQTAEDAETEATGKFRLATQRAVKMNLTIRGAPELLAKSVVNITGMGRRLSGKYYVRNVSHTISAGGGYSCNLKMITDGYQSGNGSGGAAGADIESLLQSCVAELQAARASVLGVGPLEQQVARSIDRLMQALGVVGQGAGAEQATLALAQAANADRLAQAGANAGLSNVTAAAASCASVLRQLATQADAEAEGNINTREEGDAGARTAVADIDGETGELITRYIGTRGRDA